MSIMTSDRHR